MEGNKRKHAQKEEKWTLRVHDEEKNLKAINKELRGKTVME